MPGARERAGASVTAPCRKSVMRDLTERFTATRKAMQELAEANAGDPAKHQKWVRMELALFLAAATRRRLGSIRQFYWSDFDFDAGTVRWKAEADKKRKEWIVPMPPVLLIARRSHRPTFVQGQSCAACSTRRISTICC